MNFRKSSLRMAQDKSSTDLHKFRKKLGKSIHGRQSLRKKNEDGVCSSGDECPYAKVSSQSEKRNSNSWTAEERRRKSYSMNWSPKMADLVNKFDRAHVATQQQLCMQATFLRHRKISTQLKVESLERQLELEQQLVADKKRHQQRTPNTLCEDGAEERLRELKNELKAADTDLKEMEKFGQQKLKDIENRKADTLQAWTALEQVANDLGPSASSPSIVISHCDPIDLQDELATGPYVPRRASHTPMSENEAAKMKNMAKMAAMESHFGFTSNPRQSQDDTAIPGGNKRRGRWKPFASMRFIGIKPFRRAKSADVLSDDVERHFETGALEKDSLGDGAICRRISDSECDAILLKCNQNGNIERMKHVEPRTSISPECLAEIEAFENFINEFFRRK